VKAGQYVLYMVLEAIILQRKMPAICTTMDGPDHSCEDSLKCSSGFGNETRTRFFFYLKHRQPFCAVAQLGMFLKFIDFPKAVFEMKRGRTEGGTDSAVTICRSSVWGSIKTPLPEKSYNSIRIVVFCTIRN
jgi:hypothetical protein